MDVDFVMAYENGELNQLEVIAGFQKGIDSGLVWQLQGAYGRQARYRIKPAVRDAVMTMIKIYGVMKP